VATRSPTLYLDILLRAGASLQLPEAAERALYGVDAGYALDGQPLPAFSMRVLGAGEAGVISATQEARVVLIGGEPLGHRFLWWNFASSRKQRLIQAGEDWAAGRFDAVPGETEFIPLPATRPAG
jgi:redox-sensitive bicupin YhaK (pirin superfamily)